LRSELVTSLRPGLVEAPPPQPSPASGRGGAGCAFTDSFSPTEPGVSRLEPSPACGGGLGGSKPRDELLDVSRFATVSLVPLVEARARCAAASPPARRSQELSGGGCRPVPEPMPASPRLMAGLSSSASAGPIGCTSGRCALDFGVLPDFLGASGFFAMRRIWDESAGEKRANGRAKARACVCQQMSARPELGTVARLRREDRHYQRWPALP
jgi:hypothetical protein